MASKTKQIRWQLLGLVLTLSLFPCALLLMLFMLLGALSFAYGIACLIRVPGNWESDILLMAFGVFLVFTGFYSRNILRFLLDRIRDTFFPEKDYDFLRR